MLLLKKLLKARQFTEQHKEGGQNYDQMCSLHKRPRLFAVAEDESRIWLTEQGRHGNQENLAGGLST